MPPESLAERLLECLGGPWPEPCDLDMSTEAHHHGHGYRVDAITYQVEPGERVRAFLLVPDGVDAAHPAAAVAVWHQHAGQWHLGKSEPAGLSGDPMHHTGVALAREGFVVLCPDTLCFEERCDPALPAGRYEQFQFLRYAVQGKCLAWKNILDMRRAVDLLVSRPEVLADRIGCYGHSMGSTCTWLVGPWEPRLRCLVGNCCLPTYAAIERHRLIHCFTNFVPGWTRYGDTPDIAGLVAPRPLHLNFGELDRDSPMDGVRPGLETIAAAYERAGCPERFSSFIEPGAGHVLSEAMWQRARDWLVLHLKL